MVRLNTETVGNKSKPKFKFVSVYLNRIEPESESLSVQKKFVEGKFVNCTVTENRFL